MPDTLSHAPAPAPAPTASPAPGLPTVRTALGPDEILTALETASRRGRLPGFRKEAPPDECLFAVAAHGHPFDADLRAGLIRWPDGSASLQFVLRPHRRMQVIFALVLLATIWPGVYFMDELIAQYLEQWWRPWVTYYWYLPLTIVPLPWVWSTLLKRSRRTTGESARDAIKRIAIEVGGVVES